MSSTRQQILVAITHGLFNLFHVSRGGYLQKIGPYNGEIDQTDGPDDVRRVLEGCAPGVLVSPTAAQWQSQSTQRTRYRRTITIELFLINNHMRSFEDRLLADVVAEGDPSADPGIFKMADDMFETFAGNDLGLQDKGLSPLMPSRDDVLFQVPDMTVWRLTYTAHQTLCVDPISFGDSKFTSYEINGNLVDFDGETVLPEPPNPLVEADGSLE